MDLVIILGIIVVLLGITYEIQLLILMSLNNNYVHYSDDWMIPYPFLLFWFVGKKIFLTIRKSIKDKKEKKAKDKLYKAVNQLL